MSLAFLSLACGGSSQQVNTSGGGVRESGKPLVVFPEPQQIQRFLDTPAPEGNPVQEAWTDAWVFEETPPAGTQPWHETLAFLKADHPDVRVGDDLNCLAREFAAIFQSTEKMVDDRFLRFAGARCGVAAPRIMLGAQKMHLQGEPSNDWVWAEMKKAGYDQPLKEMIKAGMQGVGLAMVRKGSMATLAMVGSLEPVRLKEVTPVPSESGLVRIEGELTSPVAGIEVVINSGESQYEECFVSREASRFRAQCSFTKDDPYAWFEVVTLENEAVLSTVAARGMATRQPVPVEYAPLERGAATATPQDFSATVFAALNQRRKTTGLSELKLNDAQSEQSAHLLPHLVVANESRDTSTEAFFTLALIAGWQVPGDIRSGDLFLLSQGSRSPTTWLNEALESPLGRSVLMAKDADVFSIGASFSHESQSSVVVNSWELFENSKHKEDRAMAFRILATARRAAGRPLPIEASNLEEIAWAVEQVENGSLAPLGAAQRAAQIAADRLGRDVWGMSLEAYDLDQLVFPDELLSQPKLYAQIAVTHYKPEGAAWAQMAVLVLLVPVIDA